MLNRAITICCVLSVVFVCTEADAGKIKSKLKGRHRTGQPGQGYDDTLNVPGQQWGVHDKERPEPWVISPPTASTQAQPGNVPSDATVLFDGTDLSQWQGGNGDAQWTVKDGYMLHLPTAVPVNVRRITTPLLKILETVEVQFTTSLKALVY